MDVVFFRVVVNRVICLFLFVENLVPIYLNNAKDILGSFSDVAVVSKHIDKNKTIISESSFLTGIENAYSLLKKFCFTAKKLPFMNYLIILFQL